MISYKDMTFCLSDCINPVCERKLTDAVIKQAEAWWGTGNAPIAVTDYSDICQDYKGENNGKESS